MPFLDPSDRAVSLEETANMMMAMACLVPGSATLASPPARWAGSPAGSPADRPTDRLRTARRTHHPPPLLPPS